MPRMELANSMLAQAARDGTMDEQNMECLKEGAQACIEMHLALRVLDEQNADREAFDDYVAELGG